MLIYQNILFHQIWLKIFRHAKATYWLEICLFPPPTQEAIELAGIHKRHIESLKKFNNKTAKRAELWQTLVCKYTFFAPLFEIEIEL